MLSPGYVFLSQPGAVHRYTHERMPSDICVSVIYSGSLIEDRPGDQFVPNNIPVAMAPTNRLAFLKLRLTQLAGDGCDLAIEEWACELISAVRAGLPKENRLYRQRQLSWYAERVHAIRELFETRYAEPHSLFSVARSVGMSHIRGHDEQGKSFDVRLSFTDTYIRRHGRWQAWASQHTRVRP